MTEKKRGKYNIIVPTKAMDESEFERFSIFKDQFVRVDKIDYLDIRVRQQTPAEYKNLFMYVKLGNAPDAWVKHLDDCKLLYAVKKEHAKQARQYLWILK